MFDYGDEDDNTSHYGKPAPPVYNMSSIPNDFPLYLSYGGKDAFSDVNNVLLPLNCLKDHDGDKLVVQYRSDHAQADSVFGVNANEVIYNPVMTFFGLHWRKCRKAASALSVSYTLGIVQIFVPYLFIRELVQVLLEGFTGKTTTHIQLSCYT